MEVRLLSHACTELAATAVVLGAELLTTNLRHFPMLEGLRTPYGAQHTFTRP